MRKNPTGFETVIVGESGELQRSERELPTIITAIDKDLDDTMFLPAWAAVEAEIDPTEYEAGTHVATIHYDVRTKAYDIEYHVEIEEDDS